MKHETQAIRVHHVRNTIYQKFTSDNKYKQNLHGLLYEHTTTRKGSVEVLKNVHS